MTPEIKEAVAFIHDALELTLGLIDGIADEDTKASLEDIKSAAGAHSMVLRAAGLIEAPVEPEVLTNPEPDLLETAQRLSSTSSHQEP